MLPASAEHGDITGLVLAYAADRRVSERTVWRWVKRARERGEWDLPPRRRECEICSRELPPGSTIRRRFCGVRCRVFAHRLGLGPESWATTAEYKETERRAIRELLELWQNDNPEPGTATDPPANAPPR